MLGVLGVLSSAALARQPEDALTVSAASQMLKVHRGDQFAIAVQLDVSPGWHMWPARNTATIPKGQDAWWTAIGPADSVAENDNPPPPVVVGTGFKAYINAIQWPKAQQVKAAGGIRLPAYAGKNVAFVPVVVADDAPMGKVTLDWAVGFQPCDESVCMGPDTRPFAVSWEVVPADQAAVTGSGSDLFKAFDASVFAAIMAQGVDSNVGANPTPTSAGTSKQASFDIFGYSFSVGANQYAIIFVIAFVAGFFLNFTPCVLPVIPIKVMSLQKQAGNRSKLLLYGAVYCVGIVAMFAVLGLMIAFLHHQWGQLFSYPWFAALMGSIVLVLGIGMMGAFTFKLPQSVYMINPAGDTLQGNFMMGILTAVLSTPCTGPFFGAALAWAATQPTWVGPTTLIIVGAGMSFPYALLIAFPKLIDRMPRSGPGGELLKQVMGGLMLAVAAFLFSNLLHAEWPWWVVSGIATASFLWAIIGGLRVLRTTRGKAIVCAIALLGMSASTGLGYVMTRPSPIPWRVYATSEGGIQKAIDEAKAAHKFVVVKFTAIWCQNCHFIEHTVYDSNVGKREMNRPDVVAIKVDLSKRSNAEGWSLLQQYSGGSGIPFSIFIPPIGEPVSYRSFFKVSDLESALRPKTASRTP